LLEGRSAAIIEAMEPTVAVPQYELSDQVEVDPQRTALLIVDMQNDFVHPEGKLFVPDAPATVPVCKALLDRARAAGARVAFSQDTHTDGDPEWAIWGEHARRGSWGWEIVPELAPLPGELVVEKPRYDAFYATPLDHQLRLWGVETVVLCGTVANICVHYTAASAALRWYRVVVAVDGISALHPFDMHAALRQTAFLFAGQLSKADGIQFRSAGP